MYTLLILSKMMPDAVDCLPPRVVPFDTSKLPVPFACLGKSQEVHQAIGYAVHGIKFVGDCDWLIIDSPNQSDLEKWLIEWNNLVPRRWALGRFYFVDMEEFGIWLGRVCGAVTKGAPIEDQARAIAKLVDGWRT